MTREELREKVRDIIDDTDIFPVEEIADQAIRVVLKAAAKVAYENMWESGGNEALANEAANKICALMPEESK